MFNIVHSIESVVHPLQSLTTVTHQRKRHQCGSCRFSVLFRSRKLFIAPESEEPGVYHPSSGFIA